jgi:hypothetical protein
VSEAQKAKLLVNLRPHVVEVHLPDRVITVGPMGSAPVTETSPQVDELVRRGLLALRDITEEQQQDDEPAGEDGDTTAVAAPAAKRTGRARGPAASTRGGD